MKTNRPVNLDITTIRFPVAALASLAHRITGVALFFAIGFLLWALSQSLSSEQGFEKVVSTLTHPLAKFIAWGIVSFVLYHLIAGVKHLMMDAGHFETKEQGALVSKVVFAMALIALLLAGVWIW